MKTLLSLMDVSVYAVEDMQASGHNDEVLNKAMNFLNIGKAVLGLSMPVDSLSPDTLVRSFIEKSHESWDKIRGRDESFFSDDVQHVFQDQALSVAEVFRTMFLLSKDGKKVMPQEYRDDIWEHFHSLVRICITYAHEKKIFSEIVERNAPLWNL